MPNLPKIVIVPTQGFCNRLRAMSAASVLAKFWNTKFYIMWVEELCCNCKFNDIFTNRFNIIYDFKEIQNKKYWYNPKIHTNEFLNRTDISEYEYIIIEGGHEFKHPQQDVLSFLNNKNAFYQSLTFSEPIEKKLNSIKETHYRNTRPIGVHFRDFVPEHDTADGYDFTKVSTPETFLRIVQNLIEQSKDTRFFLSTNSSRMIELIKAKVPEVDKHVIIANESNKSRENVDGMIDAVVDLLLLSECQYIIGSISSSFSDEACFFRNISKLCIGDKDVNEYHCYGYNKILGHKMLLANANILLDIYKDTKNP